MFCYQCEQTARGTGCVDRGTCGKTEDVAALQDLLLRQAMGVAIALRRASVSAEARAPFDQFVEEALFTTVTNVNFDADRMETLIHEGAEALAAVRRFVALAGRSGELFGPALGEGHASRQDMLLAAAEIGIAVRNRALGADVVGLQELLTYGIKGMAAYAHHARVLGRTSDKVTDFLHEALEALARPVTEMADLLALNLRCGEASLEVLALLDGANTGAMGHPVPTSVLMGHKPGKAIMVSGHDLGDLAQLLEQTAGLGINVYTHGEMLPAHGYPELNKHKHLVGHFGGAWQDQMKDFAVFPGAILMTTNCLMPPRESYAGRLFTSGVVASSNIPHIANHRFDAVIAAALAAPGFTDASEDRRHLVGFGHNAVLGVADQVVAAVKSGALKHFVLIGGCDAATSGRDYYSRLAAKLPNDWAVLTLGCGKFRVLGNVEGSIGDLPRLLDMGQCNDAYSAIKVAGALAEAFGVGVNDLPLSLVLSWFEQKAVTVLLALLHLGIRNIRIGPRLPAFITPAILQVLVDKFNVMPIGDVESDIAAMANAA
ncbi:hydroxylamine reductase [Telmatospirillum sp.]|uniref:hydroxylamine reductase n=1 Tax=Telmatospirillum sp. TaxID=2079197 RepID=UPI00284251EA|nr:hydroxylamine reductase [Telmatospirillum sp.]MDR3439173.1 hydroxylamine reductase [Telmatospirillum sp.]